MSTETLSFQTEIQQLLHLMIHSLYSNKEIFLRELISNGADACDKLRFEALGNNELYEDNSDLAIQIDYDKEAKTITIRDNGIGMSREEVIEHIGTIAKSGTKEFIKNLSSDQVKDASMIGQFGVGFYSSFIVAKKVELFTRRAGAVVDQGVHWSSEGTGTYTIENVEKQTRGTEIVLHLKEEEQEFLSEWKIKEIVNRYSDHIPVPVKMRLMDNEKNELQEEYSVINDASAFWKKPKNEIKEEDYKQFYQQTCYDYQDPLTWLHYHVEGTQEYTALLYIPAHAPFDLFQQESRHGVKLYVQRVFIMEDTKLLPRYLRFIRGVIDSNDLPLNVSREILQNNRILDAIRSGAVKRILDTLKKMITDDAEKYNGFWKEFGQVIKEGLVEDMGNRDAIADLLRFYSTHAESENPNTSLEEYISRMKPGQEKVYYISAESLSAAKQSPLLEVFKKKEIEVLLLTDRVDEWIFSQVFELKGKNLQSIAKGDLDLPDVEDKKEDKVETEEEKKKQEDFLKRLQDLLTDRISEVRVSKRLVDSPACIVVNQHDVALHLQPLLKMGGQEMHGPKPILEINTDHAWVKKLETTEQEADFKQWAELIFGQAWLAAGGQLENPAQFVQALQQVLNTHL